MSTTETAPTATVTTHDATPRRPTTILRPLDAGYDDARLGFDRRAPHRPAAVVLARHAADVAAGIRLAAGEGRRVAVQATGHGVGITDPEAVLVNTSAMTGVEVDATRRTARVQAGATAGALVAAAATHGLAPLSGSSPGVSVAGHVVSGGLPLLGRTHGWAADRLRAAEVVTADGRARRVDGSDRADDLWWALRGGGGAFAVVTALELELVELRSVYGGRLVFDAEHAPLVLRAWRDWAEDAPEALNTSVVVQAIPDVDGPPPALRGRAVVAVQIAWDGPTAEGERLVAPIRALAAPLVDGLARLPWTESASIHAEPPGPVRSAATTVHLRELPDDALDAIGADVGRPATPPRGVEIRRLGGALNRTSTDIPVRRDTAWLAGAVGIVRGEQPRRDAESFVRGWREALAPWTDGRLANFLFADAADPAAARAAYPPDVWARLRSAKAGLDPNGRILAPAGLDRGVRP